MLRYFSCPDKGKIEVSKCVVKGGCRMGKRCLTLETLKQLSYQRTFDGTFSTTQLINGTCEAFLKLTRDYTENPMDQMFKLLGTRVHGKLSASDDDDTMKEGDLRIITSHGISMQPDLLEQEDDWNILTDYKVSGSFKVGKAIGMKAKLVETEDTYNKATTIKDPESGVDITRQKGDKKLAKSWEADINKQDCLDWVRQLNYYRIGLEEKGFHIDEMRIEAIVRDGGLMSAINYGITEKVYMIPIPKIPDEEIISYFVMKKDALTKALNDGKVTEGCTSDERWGGRKCQMFCQVSEFCDFGGKK